MKIKKFLSLLAATAMTLTAITGAMTASASEVANGTCGDGITWILDSDGKLTISGEGAMATPEIPKNENDNDVPIDVGDYSEIYTYKKEHKEDIKEVVIEEGVTTIGFCSFYKMPNLETVVIPSTIKEFSGYALSSSNFAYLKKNYAFAECTKLKNLTLTENLKIIGEYTFSGCTSLESVIIPSTIEQWCPYSFEKCSSLKNITLPEGLTVIGSYAFAETGVESIVIPSTITQWDPGPSSQAASYDNHAFANCEKLSSVTFTDGLATIINSPFLNCSSLKKVVIPKSITNMQRAFENCTSLEEVYIEEGAQIPLYNNNQNSYFDKSFDYCENLKRIEIPEGVYTSTHYSWCTGCASLTDVYVHGINPGFGARSVSDSVMIHCDYGSQLYNPLSEIIKDDIEKAQKELNTAVTEAEKYAEADYTTESYGALKTALENAKKYDENSTGVLPIEWAADDIMTAIEGLEEKKDEPSSSDPSDSSSNPSDSSNPSGSDQSQPSNSGSSQSTSAQPVTNAPTTASPKVTPPAVTTTVTKPAKVKAVKLKAKKKKLNVKWKKVSGATGYEVMYATNNKFTKNKKTVIVKKNKVTLKRLKSKKKYFVKVRAYKTVNGNTYYGKWSKVVKKKVK